MRLAVLFTACVAFAQTPDSRPAYEAASIKVNANGVGSSSNGSPGQVLMVNQSLKRLVERAYGVKAFQVLAPGWMEDVHFDIAAKYPPGTKSADRPAMLRTLLEDRFKLVAHTGKRELPGYALTVSKSGFRLEPVEPDSRDISSAGEGGKFTFKARSASMTDVADYLARQSGGPVFDATGLTGAYNIELHWTVDDPADRFSAVKEAFSTLGLQLRSQKVPVDVVVVDSALRVPTP